MDSTRSTKDSTDGSLTGRGMAERVSSYRAECPACEYETLLFDVDVHTPEKWEPGVNEGDLVADHDCPICDGARLELIVNG